MKATAGVRGLITVGGRRPAVLRDVDVSGRGRACRLGHGRERGHHGTAHDPQQQSDGETGRSRPSAKNSPLRTCCSNRLQCSPCDAQRHPQAGRFSPPPSPSGHPPPDGQKLAISRRHSQTIVLEINNYVAWGFTICNLRGCIKNLDELTPSRWDATLLKVNRSSPGLGPLDQRRHVEVTSVSGGSRAGFSNSASTVRAPVRIR